MNDVSNLPEGSGDAHALARRRFLASGGFLAGGAVLGAAALGAPAGAQVNAAAVDSSYIPIGPARVFDSRAGNGPIGYGETIQLSTGFNTLTPVPTAVTLNITVTNTVGKGWIALYPSDVTFGGTSNVNWFGDSQDIANNAFVGVAPDGVVLLPAGGIPGSGADFAIDIMGASVPLDVASAVASGLAASLAAPWSRV